MSYILDALRKSAEERKKLQAREEPSYAPLAGTDTTRRTPTGSPVTLVLAVVVLVLGILVGSWFLVSPRRTVEVVIQGDDAADSQQPPTTQQPAVQAPAPAPAETADPAQRDAAEAENTVQTTQSAEPGPEEPEPALVQSQVVHSPQIPLLQELPFATQAAIPDLKFSGHVYSADPDLRMVMVNTAIVREGEMISPDIRLVEIIDNGLVLEYRQTRFRVELF